MLSIEEARKIAINACTDKLGKDFVEKYKDSSVFALGVWDGQVYCYIGVNCKNIEIKSKELLLDEEKFEYCSSCLVDLETGNISYI